LVNFAPLTKSYWPEFGPIRKGGLYAALVHRFGDFLVISTGIYVMYMDPIQLVSFKQTTD